MFAFPPNMYTPRAPVANWDPLRTAGRREDLLRTLIRIHSSELILMRVNSSSLRGVADRA